MKQPSVTLDIILSSGEIPHKITEIHVPHLIPEEKPQIFNHGGLGDHLLFSHLVGVLDPVAFHLPPAFVFRGVLRILVAPHPGEEGFEFGIIIGNHPVVGNHIFSIALRIVWASLKIPFLWIQRGIVILSVEKGPLPVLFPVKV